MRDVLKVAAALAFAIMAVNVSGQTCTAEIKPVKPTVCPNMDTELGVLFKSAGGDSTFTTEYDAYYQQRGNMFNVVAKENMVVTGLEVNCQDTTQNFGIYYRKGVFEGRERDSTKWKSLGRAKPVVGNGFDTATYIPLKLALKIPKGDTVAFYVTSTTTAYVYYGVGVSQGAVFKENKHLKVLEGIGLDWPFTGSSTGAIFTPRIWNGTIHYYLEDQLKYSWSTGDTTSSTMVNINKKTPFIVTVSSAGCTARDTIELELSENLNFDIVDDTTVCDGSSIRIDAGKHSGGKTVWKPGNATSRYKTMYRAGRPTVILTSALGCKYYDTVQVKQVSTPTVATLDDFNLCPDETKVLDVGSAATGTILWSNNKTTRTITIKKSGTYSVSVTDSGCTTTESVVVGDGQIPNINIGNDIEVCEGDTVTINNLNHAADLNYVWSTSAADTLNDLNIYTSGTYSVIATDADGCMGHDTVVAFYHDKPIPSFPSFVEDCKNATITLDAGMHGPGTTWDWSTTETTQTIDVTKTGTYSVTVVDSFGCAALVSVDANFRKLPFVDLGFKKDLCEGDSLLLDASFDDGNTVYDWSTGANSKTIDVTKAGTYSVTVTDSFGCQRSDDVDVTVFSVPVLNLGADTSICKGTSLTLDAGTHATTKWSTSEKTRTISATGGTYSVLVRNAFGCENEDEIVITEIDIPVASFSGSDVGGQKVAFTNSTQEAETYSWNFGDGSALSTEEEPTHWYKKDSTYTVKLTATNKCGENSTTQSITVIASGVAGLNAPKIALYPNPSQGWVVLDLSELNESSDIQVYDMNGQQITVAIRQQANGKVEVELPASAASGMYLLSIQSGSALYQQMLLVQ